MIEVMLIFEGGKASEWVSADENGHVEIGVVHDSEVPLVVVSVITRRDGGKLTAELLTA